MLQLGMSHEFAGATDKAKQWYQRLVKDFPDSSQAKKATGVLRRLSSIGQPLRFRAKDVKGRQLDITTPPYRGRVILIQYWGTVDDRCQEDMDALKELYAKYGGRGGFEIIGVCLDRDRTTMQQFLSQKNYLWAQVHEPGGFDGELANQLGVMTLPMMILVDQKGTVVADNIFVANLEGELKRLLGTATAQGAENAADPLAVSFRDHQVYQVQRRLRRAEMPRGTLAPAVRDVRRRGSARSGLERIACGSTQSDRRKYGCRLRRQPVPDEGFGTA